jgi:hypothetical protein
MCIYMCMYVCKYMYIDIDICIYIYVYTLPEMYMEKIYLYYVTYSVIGLLYYTGMYICNDMRLFYILWLSFIPY